MERAGIAHCGAARRTVPRMVRNTMSVAIDKARTKPIAGRDLDHLSDEELLARHKSHADRGAFEALVQRYERELYSYLRLYTDTLSARAAIKAGEQT